MWQIQLRMPRLPLAITCYADAHVSFEPMAQAIAHIDQMDGWQFVATERGIYLGQDEFIEYNERVAYKENSKLLTWLKSLNMEMPQFV